MINDLKGYYSDSLSQTEERILKKINVFRIGKIISIDNQIFRVNLIEKSIYNNKIQIMPLITCRILKNNGNIESYKINDLVLIGFFDVNYEDFHNGVLTKTVDYQKEVYILHSKSNAYILQRMDVNSINSILTGLIEENAKIGINRDTKKLTIENQDIKLKEIIENQTTLIKSLFELVNQNNTLISTAMNTINSLFTTVKALTVNNVPFNNANTLDNGMQTLQGNIANEIAKNTEILIKATELLTKTQADLNKLFT
jgi:hypothetical protein